MGEILIPYNSGGGGGVTSEDITAVKAHILKGERTITADSDGEIVEGTMTVKDVAIYTPGQSDQVIDANQYLGGAQTIKGDGNLLPQHIKNGVSIFGVTGNLIPYYVYTEDITPTGSMRMGFNTDKSESYTIYYFEGTVPDGVTLTRAFSFCHGQTEEGSNINFSNDALNFVYKKVENGSRLYPPEINSYRWQSGTSYRLPLGVTNQKYGILLLGSY